MTFASAGGRTDYLELNGTNNSDLFNVNGPADQIQVLAPGAGGLFVTDALHTGGILHAQLRGLNGDDIFNLTGALPYADILVDGGDPSASDTVNLTGATGLSPSACPTPASPATPPSPATAAR